MIVTPYERAESLLRQRLAGRHKRTRSDFNDRCVRLALWLLRAHGPAGARVFALPRCELSQDARFAARVGLTASQVRTATEALMAIGLLIRLSPNREQRFRKDPPVQFELGPDFATLFPIALSVTRHKESPRVPRKAPLFVASYKNPIPRPMRWEPPHPKDQRDLALATLAALKLQPVPKLSPGTAQAFWRAR